MPHVIDTSSRRMTMTSAAGIAVALSLALSACAAQAGAPAGSGTPMPSAPVAATPASPASPASGAQPVSQASPSEAPRTPGPSVPRVPALQAPAYASRVVIAGLGIDLPVISGDLQPPPSYPFCDVAAYVTRFNQPYEPGITYISAHAQRGMFLPLLKASERNDGQELLGQTVDVFVADGRAFTYRIDQVVRHATDYAIVGQLPLDGQRLILQTSEGPYGTLEKLQVVATLEGESTVIPAEANPPASPRLCEPTTPPASSSSPSASPAV